jgi:hypothetical protein
MQNRQQPSQNNVSEQKEYSIPQVETAVTADQEQRKQLARLLNMGFTLEEAHRLQHQRTHVYENAEMQQRQADDSKMLFARWLYEHGEMNEQ